MTWPDGTKYTGEFVDGKFNGEGEKTLPNGTKFKGAFKDDKFIGK